MTTLLHARGALAPTRLWTAGFPAWVRDGQGAELILREARREDADDIRAMHDRCSPRSLRWRYFSASSQVEHVLGWMFDVRRGRSVAVWAQGRLVALAHLVRTDTPGVAEVAFLVEDDWQDRGIGTLLVDLLTRLAADAAYERIRADVALDNDRMRHILRARGWTLRTEHGVLDARLDLS